MAVTDRAALDRSRGTGVCADAAPLRKVARVAPVAQERRDARSGAAPLPRLVPIRDDEASRTRQSRARLYCLRLILPDGPPPTQGTPLAEAPFVARILAPEHDRRGAPARTVTGQTDADGIVRLTLHGSEDRLILEIAGRTVKVRAGALTRLDGPNAAPHAEAYDEQVKLRLYNLGFGSLLPATWSDADFRFLLALFQKQHGVAEEEWEKALFIESGAVRSREVGAGSLRQWLRTLVGPARPHRARGRLERPCNGRRVTGSG